MVARRIGGRYRLLERRAIGGMAAVWRGRDERTGREVAVKLLHPHLAAEPDARRRLHREVRALQSIAHPNVVTVRDMVPGSDGPAMVMDFVDGPSLAERLGAAGPLPEGAAIGIALDIASGLAAAHAQGIVHRDIKPGNILIGPDGRARVGDFGIATEADRADLTALTMDQSVVGTRRYLAPERLEGAAATPATDVWGVGAVLYEMLTGRPAFDDPGGSLAAARSMPTRPAHAGAATWAVLERALDPDAERRFADGAALHAALAALPVAPDRPAGSSDAETVVIAVPVADVAPLPGDRPPGRQRGSRRGPWRGAVVLAAVLLGIGGTVGTAALLGLADGADRPDVVEASGDPAVPAAPSTVPTAAPTTAPTTASDGGGDGKPDKDRGKGNGNGNGRGKGKGD